MDAAATVSDEIMGTPDKGIPEADVVNLSGSVISNDDRNTAVRIARSYMPAIAKSKMT
jgi:hypothetical protein